MKALCLEGSELALRELDPPKRRAGEALLRVRMAGICRTDLELARGYMSDSVRPRVLGHEVIGDVIEADDQTWLGARVAGEINLACGHCELCLRGLPRHCSERSVLGIVGKDGGFAEYVTLPEENLHRVPAHVDDRTACFVEPLAACYEILEQVQLTPADRVLVIGDGKLGQLVTRVLHAHGATPTLLGKHESKLALARAAGIVTAQAAALPSKHFDVVVEATGSPSGMELALRLIRPRGTLVLKSTYHGKLSLDAAPIVIDELTLIGSRCGPFAPAMATLGSAVIDPTPLIDAIFPLQDALAAFQRAGEPGVMKVLLDMR